MRLFLLLTLLLNASSVYAEGTQAESDLYDLLSNIKKKWALLDNSKNKNLINTTLPDKSVNNIEEISTGIPTGELLVLSARLDDLYLGEVIAIKSPESAWIDLSSLVEQLDFAIEVNNEVKQAEGWFINKSNHFKLDLTSLTVKVKNDILSIKSGDYYLDNGDVFISTEQLNNWFDIGIQLDFGALRLNLNPRNTLPIEQKMKREERKFYKNSASSNPTLPWKASPYKAFSTPVADLQLSLTASNSRNNLTYSLLGSQDLAHLSAEYYLAGQSQDLLGDSRLSFSRQFNDVSSFSVSNFEFGDILPVRSAGGPSSSYARGIKINNKPLYKEVNGNLITLSGAITAGWDVELYRNNILIEQQLSLSDGLYYFEDVSLLFGSNTFELIFYGPQGQVERKVEEFIIDGNSLKGSEAYYELSLTQQGEKLLENNKNNESGWLFSGRYEQGISDYVSIYTGGTSLFNTRDGNDELNSYTLGSNLSLLNKFLINFNYNQNNNNETDLGLTARTEYNEQSLRLDITKSSKLLTNSTSEQKLYSDSRLIAFSMSGSLMRNHLGNLNYQNNFYSAQNDQKNNKYSFGNILNYSLGGFSINNNIQWNHSNNDSSDTIIGRSLLQKRFGSLGTRLGVGYSVQPHAEVTDYELQLNRFFLNSLDGELKLKNQLYTGLKSTELGLNWRTDSLSLYGSVGYNSDDEWRVGVFSRFSLGYDSQNNDYFINKRSLVNNGSLMVHVYLDANNNGIYDDGEQNLEGVKVKGLQNYRRAVTDKNGMALLSGMPANLTTDIVIEPGSISEPFLVAANDGFSITPRAGFVEYMEMPLNNSSELEGTVYKQDEQGSSEVQPFATVKLLDKQGKQVAQTQAAYDGYYLFTDLRPGEYKAVIDDEFKQRKSLKDTQQVVVKLPAQGEVVMGVDFELKEKTQTPAYIANAGGFSSLPIMKAYYQLIKRHLNEQSKRDAFYIKDDKQKRYILAVAYAESAQGELEQVCAELKVKGLNCQVQAQLISH
ncbi:hypothetical protein BG00_10850 [Pseudoalteromonas sp. SCSIO_11900]|uniref:MSCRAMM family protein n=1 Tax=Pseudoalteromonas sp. SCSIO_11900 TaxID=1461766 RepID=UPI0004483F72|nr:hypothetical protein [Pseudoalteromonas sp. SCSIO_11900]EWS98027.1 hypothetical protein BG00_10850 [Pseudoalteromonas sp. SCSIO_11900]